MQWSVPHVPLGCLSEWSCCCITVVHKSCSASLGAASSILNKLYYQTISGQKLAETSKGVCSGPGGNHRNIEVTFTYVILFSACILVIPTVGFHQKILLLLLWIHTREFIPLRQHTTAQHFLRSLGHLLVTQDMFAKETYVSVALWRRALFL